MTEKRRRSTLTPRTRRKVGQNVEKPMPEVDELLTAEDAEELRRLMTECAKFSEDANLAKRSYDLSRTQLYNMMKKHKLPSWEHAEATVNGQQVHLTATLEAKPRQVVDIDKLKKLVSADVFAKCVSAAVGTVEAEAGKAILSQCTVEKKSEENVTVKKSARKK